MRYRLIWLFGLLLLVAACPAKPADPCAGVVCGNGQCVVDQGRASCTCQDGFLPLGLSCVAVNSPPVDPCANNPCTGTGKVCVASGGQAHCTCPTGYVAQGTLCVLPDPSPNPCTAPHQAVCTAAHGATTCSCDPGYAPEGSGCASLPVFDCANQHTGPSEDAFEPNECPSLATPLGPDGLAQSHSIAPVGDEDWFSVSAPPNHVLEAVFTGSAMPLFVDVYDSDGLTAVAGEHRGLAAPTFPFLAGATGQRLLRVRPMRANDTGGYSVALFDLGIDDYPNTAAAALVAVPGGSFAGEVQYAGDSDYLGVSVEPGHSYVFTLSATTSASVRVDVIALDGTTVVKTLDRGATVNQSYVAHSAVTGVFLLRAKGASVNTTGAFSVGIADLGADDHGDSPADATPVLATGLATAGQFERVGDVDVLSFPVVGSHIYAVTCLASGYSGCVATLRDGAGTVLASSSSSYNAYVAAEAAASGTWTVSLTGPSYGSTAAGPYTWKLEDLGIDDHGDTPATASPIVVGTGASGRLEMAGDDDVFSFTTVAGHIYRATCTPGAGLSSCGLALYDASGTPVSGGSSSGPLAFLATGGKAYVEVSSWYSGYTGSYSLVVVDVGADDHGDTAATATAVTVGSAAAGTLQYPADKDVFSFAAVASHIYTVVSTGPALAVKDASGVTVASSSYSTGVSFKAASGGTFTVEVSYSYSSGTVTAYTLTVTDVGLDDHGDTAAAATAITPGAAATAGNIQYSADKDVFSFTTVASHVFSATCSSSTSVCGLTVRNAAGTTVATSSGSSSAVASFLAATAATYTVEVSPPYSGYLGSYQLAVSDSGLDDHGDTPAAATSLTVGGAATAGQIQFANDKDVFAFPTTVDHVYRFTCTSSTSSVCALTVRTPAGVTLTTTYSGTATQASFVAAAGAGYSVEVASSYTYTGGYAVQVFDDGLDDFGDTPATGAPLTLGAAATSGSIQYGYDKDVFTFAATAGRLYRVTCTSSSYDVCALVARDPSASTVASASDSTSSQVGFKALVTGSYSVEVSAYSSYTGAYSVQAVELADDYGDTAATAQPVSVGAVTTGNLEITSDQDWFSVTLAASTSYTVTTTGLSLYVSVYDSTGVTALGYSGYGSKTFTTTTAGTYYVMLSSTSSYYVGAYTVRVQ